MDKPTVKVGLVGLGKMGLSHLAILNAHPMVEVAGVCDASNVLLSGLRKYSSFATYQSHSAMYREAELDAVLIAAPTKFHKDMVLEALDRGLAVFVEKPLTLSLADSFELVDAVEKRGLVNQVGYHNRFIATFCRARELLRVGALGPIYHATAESYGPVVVREALSTWRSDKKEGGGCLYDYASHVINLVDFCLGESQTVRGTVLKSIFSSGVEDAVYSTLHIDDVTCQLAVNWSENTYRKMSTQLTVYAKAGKLIVDAHELKIFSNEAQPEHGLESGWTIQNITTLAQPVGYHLRGEEYSGQIDHFIQGVASRNLENRNSFASAMRTDRVIGMLNEDTI